MTRRLLVSTKHMTAFTQEYLSLISDYSQVLSARKDSLMSIYHSQVITREYKTTQQELLSSIFNSSIIAREQCIPHVAQTQHTSYLQNSQGMMCYTRLFVNLDVSCTI